MYQAIKTKYLGPTNFKGSRVKASCEAGSITIGWKSELGVDDNHKAAIAMLIKKLGWPQMKLAYGWDKHSMVAVQTESEAV